MTTRKAYLSTDADDFDALVEIVDALATALAEDQTINIESRRMFASIAERSTQLYRKRSGDDEEQNNDDT